MGVCNCSMFCCTLLYVHSSIAIILMGKRELVALLNLSSWCLVMVERLFLAVPRGCLQFVIVVFPDHTHLLFLKSDITKEFGTKMDSLKESFDLEMGAVTARVESLETRLNEALNGEATDRSTKGLGRAIDQNIVIRNLTMPQGETNEVLLASLSEMFLQIGVHVTILEAVRIIPARTPATTA